MVKANEINGENHRYDYSKIRYSPSKYNQHWQQVVSGLKKDVLDKFVQGKLFSELNQLPIDQAFHIKNQPFLFQFIDLPSQLISAGMIGNSCLNHVTGDSEQLRAVPTYR